ncbi:cytochrome c oxidase subunit II [Algicella marina]|uniref:Cytochrome c oxidase subunit 2 n=1 Tax=Algicella marina TaxID=2683284 RepID=A0A6P1T1Q8_9RHOB|nr:cytochrome c oxidase subunit II [Algicella marina]QHQ35671.1 cytochrome c oxidase subunit II [Algicella marina]
MKNWLRFTLTSLAFAVLAPVAHAQEEGLQDLPVIGKPHANGIAFQKAVTEVAHDIHWLDSMLLVIITIISLFVTALLAICAIKYNSRANKVPARFTHNSTIEVAWTVVPILILIVIGSFSLPTLFKQLEVPEADLTIKATGYQWFWGYEYPDEGIDFEAYMLGLNKADMDDEVRAELAEYGYAEDEWKLATDRAVVVPVDKVVRLQVTAGDVIHAWKIPAFGVHIDGVPGRLNETWFRAEEVGVYFGQCSELCGKNHAYMPITVKVVTEEQYAAWVEASGGTVANVGRGITVAAAE